VEVRDKRRIPHQGFPIETEPVYQSRTPPVPLPRRRPLPPFLWPVDSRPYLLERKAENHLRRKGQNRGAPVLRPLFPFFPARKALDGMSSRSRLVRRRRLPPSDYNETSPEGTAFESPLDQQGRFPLSGYSPPCSHSFSP